MATNGTFAHQDQHKVATEASAGAPGSIDATTAPGSSNDLSKDEVGWYFVEQYYTTLSKSPEKLHLFYGKRSQFVWGLEAEVANVSVGRSAIQERIKQLDFQDCKVRVSNVDSQASFDNIVIQVIGESSNKAAEPKKFVQTFVLAQQPTGYFVLNDILRYIEEGGEDAAPPALDTAAEETEPAQEKTVVEVPAEDVDADAETGEEVGGLKVNVIAQKLEEVRSSEDIADVNGDTTEDFPEAKQINEPKVEEPAPADPEATAEQLAEQLAEEDLQEPEKPTDPSPTPVTKPAAQPVEPAAPEPAAPPKPMTWASRAAAAAAAGPRPVVPLPKTATPPATNQSRAPAPPTAATTAAAPVSSPQASAAPAPATESASKETSGWQTAGADSKRQNRPQSISSHPGEKEGTMGYVKYVTEKVQEADLRDALTAHGELTYFDINRSKNCAFVEYKTNEGYQAAVTANPHVVNGENIVVEPRRPKSTAYGGSNYGSGRTGSSGRGRGGYDGNRPGGQGGSRGNFSGQNRGRGGAARGNRA